MILNLNRKNNILWKLVVCLDDLSMLQIKKNKLVLRTEAFNIHWNLLFIIKMFWLGSYGID